MQMMTTTASMILLIKIIANNYSEIGVRAEMKILEL